MLRIFPPIATDGAKPEHGTVAAAESPFSEVAAPGSFRTAPVYHGRLDRRDIALPSVEAAARGWDQPTAKTLEGAVANTIKKMLVEHFAAATPLMGPAQFLFANRWNNFDRCSAPVDAILKPPNAPPIVLEIYVSPRGNHELTPVLANGLTLARILWPSAYGCKLIVDCSAYNALPVKDGVSPIGKIEAQLSQRPSTKNGCHTIRVDGRELSSRLQASGMDGDSYFRAFIDSHNFALEEGRAQRRLKASSAFC